MATKPQPTATTSQASAAAEARAATRVTLIGMILDLVLGVIKCIGGALFHSQALLVDGIHSFSDAASDLVVIAVMKVSRLEPDQGHPYGHQRFETLGTMILGATLIAVGGALAWDNLERLFVDTDAPLPEWPVLAAALLSVVGKEWIFRYTRKVGLAIRSELLVANAWHSRTDALSSIVVLVSTLGAMAGFVWLDALAAVVIAVLVGHVGWGFTWRSVKELVDTGLPEEELERLKEVARTTEGVRNVHDLRSRRMGHNILVDVHLVVSPDISVSEGHQVGMQVVARMRESLPDIAHITFHIDAENDEQGRPTSLQLPSRKTIQTELEACLSRPVSPGRLRLHYLRNKVHLELFVEDRGTGPEAEALARAVHSLEQHPWFGSLRIWHGPD
ncbi:cation diffusion facilitator family transporter [Marinobacter xestospongiae]|uniref:Cation diffusion facilitator family transporter n=1 Tax=Marinobacter xestospongiae TaxID=994319 RepID=A0ABU3W2H1_9GAMM|nr:cation diffusion facilitator family transporter [Marinobacter xestospongiae]MDV2080709.1 cation diffusion facilitator family transporter [Marinobacter xestospongiae]